MSAVGELLFGHVRDVENLLQREQAELTQHGLFVDRQALRAGRLPGVQSAPQPLAKLQRLLLFFRRGPLERLLGALDPLVDGVEVFEAELGVDRPHVGNRIDPAFHVNDVVVLEAAHDVGDGVRLADVGQKLISEPFPLGRATHQSRDVDEVDGRRHRRLRVIESHQGVEAFVGDRHHADVRLDGAEGIVGDRRAGGGKGVEKGGLADVG